MPKELEMNFEKEISAQDYDPIKSVKDYYEEMLKDENEQSEKDKEFLIQLKQKYPKIYSYISDWLTFEENGIYGYYKIVTEPIGEYESRSDIEYFDGMWIDQYTSPMIEDDYHGYLTIKLSENEYLQASFDLS